jgi:hypothetical protein
MENSRTLILRNRKKEIAQIAKSLNPKALPKDPRHLRYLASLRLTLGIKKDEVSDEALMTFIRRSHKAKEEIKTTQIYKGLRHLTSKDLIAMID